MSLSQFSVFQSQPGSWKTTYLNISDATARGCPVANEYISPSSFPGAGPGKITSPVRGLTGP